MSNIMTYQQELKRLQELYEKHNEEGLNADELTEYGQIVDLLSEVIPVVNTL